MQQRYIRIHIYISWWLHFYFESEDVVFCQGKVDFEKITLSCDFPFHSLCISETDNSFPLLFNSSVTVSDSSFENIEIIHNCYNSFVSCGCFCLEMMDECILKNITSSSLHSSSLSFKNNKRRDNNKEEREEIRMVDYCILKGTEMNKMEVIFIME